MPQEATLTLIEILNLALDRGVSIGENFPIGNQTYRMCMNDQDTLFMHENTQAYRSEELLSVTI